MQKTPSETRSPVPSSAGKLALRALAACALASGVLSTPRLAFAHAVLTAPRPRDMSDEHKDPNGPCGLNRTAVQPMTTPPLLPGAMFNVTWNETVNHPGCFIVDFSASNDANWVTLTTVPHKTTGGTPRPYSAMVTLPGAPCTACTLRLRQIMLNSEPAAGAACPPANLPSGSTYFSCANVVLAGGAIADGGASDVATATGGRGGGGGRAGGSSGSTGGGSGSTGGNTGGTTSAGTGGTSTGGATASGGAVGSGGLPASGGSTVMPGSGGATVSGSGGASSGSGGASASGGAGPGGGINEPEPAACACAVTSSSPLAVGTSIFGLLLALAVRRGRARGNKKQ